MSVTKGTIGLTAEEQAAIDKAAAEKAAAETTTEETTEADKAEAEMEPIAEQSVTIGKID